MTRQFRFVEHPPGKWRVEEKGWFFWGDVTFFGKPLLCVREPILPPIGYVALMPVNGTYVFDSLADAQSALSEALTNVAYRRVVYP